MSIPAQLLLSLSRSNWLNCISKFSISSWFDLVAPLNLPTPVKSAEFCYYWAYCFWASLIAFYFSISYWTLRNLYLNSSWICSKVGTFPLYQGWALISFRVSLSKGLKANIAFKRDWNSGLKKLGLPLCLLWYFQKVACWFLQINL